MEKKRRGRPSKAETGETKVIITDSLLDPFFIEKDNNNYTLIEKFKPTRGFAGQEASGKDINKVVGYYTKLGSALKRVSKLKTNKKSVGEISLNDYINNWDQTQQDIDKLISKLNNKA